MPPFTGNHIMTIDKIHTGKKRFLDLLLMADEQESMIDRYLDRGEEKGIREIPGYGRTIPK